MVPDKDLAQLTGLVADGARDELDPIGNLDSEFALSKQMGGRGSDLQAYRERSPSLFAALVLMGAGALILLGRRGVRPGWKRELRYVLESLIVVLFGLGGAEALVRVQSALRPTGELRPLVKQARMPFGVDCAREQLENALRAEGYTTELSFTEDYGWKDNKVLLVDVVGADVPTLFERLSTWPGVPARKKPYLRAEIAGDAGQWACAVRVDAGEVSEAQRGEWQALLTRVLQGTRRN
jgi:hypothetical protein